MFYVAAILIVTGVALFVAAPLGAGLRSPSEDAASQDLVRLDHDRTIAMQALADLEFDREMGKLSEGDYGALRRDLEDRALTAMEDIERTQTASRPLPRVVAPPAGARGRVVRFCPQCGGPVASAYRFCAQCGAGLSALLDSSREAG